MPNRILVDVEENYPEPAWLNKIEAFADKVLSACGYDREEVSFLFCSDPFIQNLNAEYRKIDSPTDVLSFENGESYTDEEGNEWFSAGDIVISLDTLPKNAEYFEVDEDEELKRLIVHGILHLNGYDHGEEHVEKGKEPDCEMLILQKKIMKEVEDEHLM
ncbi:rRNA maturation RNase YbeY [Treponema sp.]|uniref:rRNA maturation RNase YbeY n=1 Tax=Treponema sp. TaxID=166 RepID=UPI0025D5BA95|nr:rRNA maturation RNase YbeY [Treponema sp.]MCR5218280.1 rRNA maturation RNase YbeY [Treponema sp.]